MKTHDSGFKFVNQPASQPSAKVERSEAIQLQDNRAQSTIQKKQADGLANRLPANSLVQRKPNNTGLPDNLKSGIENLSGLSMDNVKVRYNSPQPAQLNAHAYAQGTDIHIGPGQEKHLPHEAWHVVQQQQGRVRPTMQMKGRVSINDDSGLEKEADIMGAKAASHSNDAFVQRKEIESAACSGRNITGNSTVQRAIKQPDIRNLKDAERIHGLIERYNITYKQKHFDELVNLAHSYEPANADEAASLKSLIYALDVEAGNREVVRHRVNLPRNMNDADEETMRRNCALTSVGAVVGKTAGEVNEDLGAPDRAEQESDIFVDHKKHGKKGRGNLDQQINGMVSYIISAFTNMGFAVNVKGIRDEYTMMSPQQGLAAMKMFPTGTKFLVYLSKTRDVKGTNESGAQVTVKGMSSGAHWVFADRYGSQVFFYDYQVGRVQKEVQRQGARVIAGGGSSPVRGSSGGKSIGGLSSFDFAAAFERNKKKRSESAKPVVEQEMPKATFHGAIPLYDDPSTVRFSGFNEMFFVAIVPHIASRQKLRAKLGGLH